MPACGLPRGGRSQMGSEATGRLGRHWTAGVPQANRPARRLSGSQRPFSSYGTLGTLESIYLARVAPRDESRVDRRQCNSIVVGVCRFCRPKSPIGEKRPLRACQWLLRPDWMGQLLGRRRDTGQRAAGHSPAEQRDGVRRVARGAEGGSQRGWRVGERTGERTRSHGA